MGFPGSGHTDPFTRGDGGELLLRRGVERRAVVLGASAVMLAGVVVGVGLVPQPKYGIALLAVLPIALLALELGLRGGLAIAALATGLLAAGAASGHPPIDALGVASRALVYVAIAGLAGRFSDRMRAAYTREARLLASGLDVGAATSLPRLAGAVEAAALRIPGVRAARVRLGDGSAAGATPGAPLTVRGTVLGHVDVDAPRLHDEDRAALALLAQQAALAVDNQRLLERDRERAAVEAELLHERSGLGHLLAGQEAERGRIAQRLHEELAQVLTAVLLGLRVVQRDAPGDRDAAMVDGLYDQVRGVLAELRDLAGSLRPAALSDLGLRPALEALARGRSVALDLDGLPAHLAPELQTGLYRIVEEALAGAHEPPAGASEAPAGVRISRLGDVLEVALDLPGEASPGALDAVRARARLLGGDTEPAGAHGTGVTVRLPLGAAQPVVGAEA